MSTSDLLTRMYAMPSKELKRQQQMLMQKLHTTHGSPTTEATAPSVHCFNGSDQTYNSCSDPYLQRVFWLLKNSKGFYFAELCAGRMVWVESANAVPERFRLITYNRMKTIWLQLRDLALVQDELLTISPVTFYAHCSTPTTWCALDD